MDTTRQRILEQLKIKHSLSAAELSSTLGTTPANIRHHLGILLQEGVIEGAGQLRERRRGRPTRLYHLARQAHAHNLDSLAEALLDELLEGLTPAERQAALRRIARRLGNPSTSSANLTQRLNACVKLFNEMNYQARWEARAPQPRFVLSHCPYATILSRHPELCQIDASLLEEMLDTSVTQSARLSPAPQGGNVCIFMVNTE